MNNSFSELRRLLNQGAFSGNFQEVASAAFRAADTASRPLPFFVLWAIFRFLDIRWSERPLPEAHAIVIEEKLIRAIAAYLDEVETGISPEVETEHLNHIAAAYITVAHETRPNQ